MQKNSSEHTASSSFPLDTETLQNFVAGQFRLVDNIYDTNKSVVYSAVAPIGKVHKGAVAVKFSKRTDIIKSEYEIGSKFSDIDEVIDYIDMGCRDGLGFIATDFADGTLEESKVVLSFGERLRLLRDISFGIFAVHYGGYVHRDIKPSNMFIHLAKGRRATVGDFGLAFPTNTEGIADLNFDQKQAMTPGWSSPEQYDLKEITQKTDVFSAGLTLSKVLFGRNPFNLAIGENDDYVCEFNSTDEIKRVLSVIDNNDDFARYIDPQHFDNATESLKKVITRCISVDPDVRPDSEELSYALEREVQRS